MRLDRVVLHGIGPFAHFEVDLRAFGDAKLIAVCGENGAGKSCFLEMALPGAMFRECPTQGTVVGRATGRDSYVESTLTNGKTYTVRQSADVVTKKGETLLLDAGGTPVLPGTGVAAFDVWAKVHFPKPEVLFSTVFWAQQSKGFIGEGKGDRKAILLRTKGVERYEKLAKAARERGAAAKNELDTLRARVEDERERGGNVEAFEAELEVLEMAATSAAAALEDARGALEIGKNEKPALELARREAKAIREKRAELSTRISVKTAERSTLELKIRKNRGVLEEADAIRAAKARSDELGAEIAALESRISSTSARRMAAVQEQTHHEETVKAASERARLARGRAGAARVRLGNRAQIDAAASALPGLEDALQRAECAELEASAALERVRGERLAGADERIAGLRNGLAEIATTYAPPDDLQGIARDSLTADDAAVGAADALPGRLGAAETALVNARAAEQQLRVTLTRTRALAARAPELEAAERELEQAGKDEEAAQAEYLEADDKRVRAGALADEHAATNVGQQQARDGLRREQAELAPLVAKAGPLENAKGRLAELEPQLETVIAELAELGATLAATPEPPAEPKLPEIATLEAAVSRAETSARAATDAVALAGAMLERARESVVKMTALEAQASRLEGDLADWAKLGADLGRDGLQAMEIDAAAPELTELTNDLLRSCLGPRWTVSLETTKASADGKRELEGCEVRVIDTERGRDADAKDFSGGERVLIGEALSLALTMLDCRRSGLEGCSIIRDETGAALSPENGRAYIQMLRRAAELIGASRVLFVTHDPALAEMADARIDVGASA